MKRFVDVLGGKLMHAVAYYPELWSESEIDKDIIKMQHLGINVVRMAEFAWSTIESVEGKIDFTVFDRAIVKLGKANIKVILGTPTVTPPRWFSLKYPQSMHVDSSGSPMSHGSREHVCISNDDYIRHSIVIASQMAKHYGNNENIIAWQIHNEINFPVRECFCKSCLSKWHKWLENKYVTIDNLNKCWGNAIWSMQYPTFDSVIMPTKTPYLHNTALTTNFSQFNHHAVANYIGVQADAIRKYSTSPITTNLNRIFYNNMDLIFEKIDFASFDEYSEQNNWEEIALSHDLFRNAKQGVPCIEIETSPSHGGCISGTNFYQPFEFLASEAVSAMFGGGEGFAYWLWRQNRAGCEQLHGHVLTAFGDYSPAYKSIIDTRNKLSQIELIMCQSTPAQSNIAMIYSDNARTYFMSESYGEIDYYRDILTQYKALLAINSNIDVLQESSIMSGYKLIFVPLLPYLNDNLLNKLSQAMNEGATVICGAFTGSRDINHTLYTEQALGNLEKVLAKKVKYVAQLGRQNAVYRYNDIEWQVTGHCAMFGSDVGQGAISGGYCDGDSLIAETIIGKGKLVVLGGNFDKINLTKILTIYASEVGISIAKSEYGIKTYSRIANDGKTIACHINMTDSDKRLDEKVILKPNDFVII